ncbi:hypothetical protein Dimus_024542 [Dionaea muscipula]
MRNDRDPFKKRDVVKSKVRGVDFEFDHEKRKVNPPRVMIGHTSYVISMKDHELPYEIGSPWFLRHSGVPLVDKKGEEPKRYDFFQDTFLTMCKLTRENEIWWIGSERIRRDDDVDVPEKEAEEEDEGNKDDFDWEAVIDEATVEGESGSGEKFYDAKDENQGSPEVQEEIPKKNSHVVQISTDEMHYFMSRPSCPT